jgi:hypothetical protein
MTTNGGLLFLFYLQLTEMLDGWRNEVWRRGPESNR